MRLKTTIPKTGFRRFFMFALSLCLWPAPLFAANSAQQEYQRLRPIFHRLEHSSKPMERDRWIATIKHFEALAQKTPESPWAPKALFSAARLWQRLSVWSGANRDLDYTLAAYDRLVGSYPRSSLADDALIAQAELLRTKRAEYAGARQKLHALLKAYPQGDQIKLAREMLSAVPGASELKTQTAAKAKNLARPRPFRVIIDPGHGGHDGGAQGRAQVREKDVVLGIALHLAKLLRADGVEALLTRESDRFVSLDQRAAFANRHAGDLLLSIHANAHHDKGLNGVETYYLDVEDRTYPGRLKHAMRTQKQKTTELNVILNDIATKGNTRQSAFLAEVVQKNLVPVIRGAIGKVRDLGTKAAVFQILMDTQMPSVLAEVAFLSNPLEAKLLAHAAGQRQLAQAMHKGIMDYLQQSNPNRTNSLAVLSRKR
ncbi:MAG: N-acetylmuramoyl-L-alanine amidase [Myxococcota bacterium]|nr:N-acetylmuramoyl-L-alanine amidase [Myxococcota bacterium]